MHVIGLRINNFARLVAVDIAPSGNVVRLTGENGEGKTSILTAIWTALKGKSAAPKAPVHQGAKAADIRLDLGKYIVTRTFTLTAEGDDYTTSVTVENADGARFPSPQKLLDSLVGDIAFDPLVFARSKSDEQFDELASFAPGIDFKEIEALNKGDYDKRTDVNKRAKEARAAANLIVVPKEIPEKINTQPLVEQLAGATQREREIAEHGRQRQALQDRLDNNRRRASENDAERARLEARLKELAADREQINADIAALADEVQAFPAAPERINSEAVAADLNAAQAKNQQIDEVLKNVEKRASLERMAASLEAESEALTKRMNERDNAKNKAISEAKMPVEGLGFGVDSKGNGYVTLNGLPFSQASRAEQIKTSVAIAASKNPTLRIIHIGDASLLDKHMNAWLDEFAKRNDLQVWCEIVGEDPKVGFVIHDGRATPAQVQGEAA